jgi:NAD(P)H-nitrite reductase large subunit
MDLLEVHDITLIEDRASFIGPSEVDVAGRRVRGDTLLIATDSRAWAPPIPGFGEVDWLDSTRALDLQEATGFGARVQPGKAPAPELGPARAEPTMNMMQSIQE